MVGIKTGASLGVVIWKTRQHSAFQTSYFRDREHQTAQSLYGVVSFLDGTGGSRSYSPSLRNYQGLEIEASRDGRGTFRRAKEFWCRTTEQTDYR